MVLRNKLFIIIFSVIVIIVAAATMYFYSAAFPDVQRKPGLPPVTEQKSEEPEENQEPIEISGLVLIQDIDSTIVIDMPYATPDNFTGQTLYPAPVAVLARDTAEKLKQANSLVKAQGFTIKVWDAYRPLGVQRVLWELVPDSRYVANPQNGSRHNRGAAVDVTLVDDNGIEVEMPSAFDDFSPRAWRNNQEMSGEARRHLEILTKAMMDSGFTTITTEWWHYDDAQWAEYPLLDVELTEFIKLR